MKFYKVSAWRNFHSIQLRGNSNQKVFLSRLLGNLGKMPMHLSSASSLASALQKIIFAIKIFFLKKKVEYSCSFLCLVMVSVSLCYKYLVLYDFLFIQSKVSIGVLEKSYLNIWKHPFWYFKKTTAPKISAYFAYFPASFLIILVGLPGITPKSSLEQLFCRQAFIRAS